MAIRAVAGVWLVSHVGGNSTMKRGALPITIAAVLGLALAGPVLAAAPGNDLYAGRTVITAVPYTTTVDTTEATTDADDVEANAECGAPATDASVWFEITAAADGGLLVQLNDSDYSAGAIVATGAPGSFGIVACGPGAVAFTATAGETYAILVFDDQFDETGSGGTLNLTVDEVPPPPELELTVDATGRFDAKTGAATIKGTVTCTGGDGSEKSFIDVSASQLVGRFRISGQGGTSFDCDGSTHPWAAEVVSSDGKFGGGKASVSVFAFACSAVGCDDVQVTASVNLRK